MQIKAVAMTLRDKDTDEVRLIMQGEMPEDCVVIFIKREDYDVAKKAIIEA